MCIRLHRGSGPEFDRAYAKLIVNQQKNCLKSFDRESRSGQIPTLKQYAAKTLPRLQDSQMQAEQLIAEPGGVR